MQNLTQMNWISSSRWTCVQNERMIEAFAQWTHWPFLVRITLITLIDYTKYLFSNQAQKCKWRPSSLIPKKGPYDCHQHMRKPVKGLFRIIFSVARHHKREPNTGQTSTVAILCGYWHAARRSSVINFSFVNDPATIRHLPRQGLYQHQHRRLFRQ